MGLAGALALSIAAFLGGALPGGDLASTPMSVARGPHGGLILCCWLAGNAALTAAWWAARSGVPSVRWVAATITMWLLPFIVVPPTGSRDVYSYACQGYLFANGLSPYEVGVATLPCPWLDSVAPIWRDTPAPYGPLFMLLAVATVKVGGSLGPVIALWRVIAVVGVVATAVCLPTLARRCGVPAERALWTALAGPVVGVHLLGGAHGDALMLGLIMSALALLVTRAGRPAGVLAAGALLGLAVAVKVSALVVLPFAALAAVAGPVRFRTLLRDGGWLCAGSVSAMGAVTAVSGLGVGWIAGLGHAGDLVQFTSPPTAVGMTLTYAGRLVVPGADAVPAIRGIALALLVAFLMALWWGIASRRGDVPRAALHGAALALAATVSLAPSFHPWYVTWPLVLLAATTIHTDLIMAVAAASAFLVLPDGSGLARFAKFPGAPLMTALVVVFLVVRSREVLRNRGLDTVPYVGDHARRTRPGAVG
ncbi:alpha-(1-_6)-mannopyranosyltransferase A [Krasilnikovia sp. MM14-A1259]